MSPRRRNSEGGGAVKTRPRFNGPRSRRVCSVRNLPRERFLRVMNRTVALTQCALVLGDDAIEVPNEAGTMDATRCRTVMAVAAGAGRV